MVSAGPCIRPPSSFLHHRYISSYPARCDEECASVLQHHWSCSVYDDHHYMDVTRKTRCLTQTHACLTSLTFQTRPGTCSRIHSTHTRCCWWWDAHMKIFVCISFIKDNIQLLSESRQPILPPADSHTKHNITFNQQAITFAKSEAFRKKIQKT